HLKQYLIEELYIIGASDSEVRTDSLKALRSINLYSETGNHDSERIASLEGLQHASHLTYIRLEHHQVDSLEPLSELAYLDTIEMSFNQLTAIPSLSESVRSIALSDNAIVDASGLSGLTNLDFLQLNNNRIMTLPVLNAHQLDELEFRNNQLSDISALAQSDLP